MLVKFNKVLICLGLINFLIDCSPVSLQKNKNKIKNEIQHIRKARQQQQSILDELHKQEPVKEPVKESVKESVKEPTKEVYKESLKDSSNKSFNKDGSFDKNLVSNYGIESNGESNSSELTKDSNKYNENISENTYDKENVDSEFNANKSEEKPVQHESNEEHNVRPSFNCQETICCSGTNTNSNLCGSSKTQFKNAKKIAQAGNLLAAVATAKVASPFLISSAKTAAYFSLLPAKYAAKGAVLGTLIAKPFVVTSAITGAKATKIAYFFVGRPISRVANALAAAETLREKILG